jgi:predicted TIM-barrel fold metal-dependent hydrolase
MNQYNAIDVHAHIVPPEPTKIVARANLDPDTRERVLGGNARRLFHL